MDELERIIEVFGAKSQKIVSIEELAELIKEICKDLRGELNRTNMVDEIADVQIMLWQLREIYHIGTEEIEKRIKYKLRRTIQRIENDRRCQTYTWSMTEEDELLEDLKGEIRQ